MLHEVLYSSVATSGMVESELDELLERARVANAARGISGMLVYNNRSFVQLLEGPRDAVESVLAKVRRDRRHTGVRVLATGTIAARTFAEWSMAFHRTVGVGLPAEWRSELAGDGSTSAGARLFQTLKDELLQLPDFDRIRA